MPHVRRRGNKWQISVEKGVDPLTGERQRVYQTIPDSEHMTKTEAEKEMAKLVVELEYGTYIEPENMKLGEFLLMWLEDECEPNLAPRSYQSYERILKKHLIPALGRIPLQKLEPVHVKTYQTKKLKTGRQDNKEGGLSNNTVRKHRQILSQALNYGVGLQMLKNNPCEHVKAPKGKRPTLNYWNQDEVSKALREAEGQWIYDFILLAVHTGMRRGEILGLKWENVNLDDGNIYVMHVLQRIRNKGLLLKEYPKTSKSRRNIDISKQAVLMLKQRKNNQTVQKEENENYKDNDLVFSKKDGSMCNPSSITRRFNRIQDKIDVKRIRLHDLRHTHATLLLKANIHPKVVQERLGHESINTTLDTYSHVIPTMQKEAASKMDEIIDFDPDSTD